MYYNKPNNGGMVYRKQETDRNLPEVFHEFGLAVLHFTHSSLEGVVDGVSLFTHVPRRVI